MNHSQNSSPHILFAKFFTNSTPPSKSDTEKSLRKQCNLSGDIEISPISDMFVFSFTKEDDKKRVLFHGHYYINGVMLVIKDPKPCKVIDFTLTSFIVTVVGLPSYLFIESYLPTLKTLLGDENAIIRGKTDKDNNTKICCKVQVDLKKALKPGFYIGEYRFVEFKYKNLGDFCYNCGMIGHVNETCPRFKLPRERNLNATSRIQIYGPWLRASSPMEPSYQFVLMDSPEKHEFDKTLSYPQFFIELEFNDVHDSNSKSMSETKATHRFRFPCSYLNEYSNSIDFITSKAYEVIEKEIYENIPFNLDEFGDKTEEIKSLVELIKNDNFCSDDMWFPLKLQINRISNLTPVDYETMLSVHGDMICTQRIENRISDLIKTRVENNEDLLSLSSWENQIREVISEMGCFTHYTKLYDVSTRAYEAMEEAVMMEISSTSCPKPADKTTFSCFKCFKVDGSDMDRLDQCVICGEEMFLGEEATTLPCSHVFHRFCIEKWFHVGHKCPLCGFELPTQK